MTYETTVALEKIRNLSIVAIEEGGARNIKSLQEYNEFKIGIVDMAIMDGYTMPEYVEQGQYIRYVPVIIYPKYNFR